MGLPSPVHSPGPYLSPLGPAAPAPVMPQQRPSPAATALPCPSMVPAMPGPTTAIPIPREVPDTQGWGCPQCPLLLIGVVGLALAVRHCLVLPSIPVPRELLALGGPWHGGRIVGGGRKKTLQVSPDAVDELPSAASRALPDLFFPRQSHAAPPSSWKGFHQETNFKIQAAEEREKSSRKL